MNEKMSAFIALLCATRISEDAIQGICAMMWENVPAMDELVEYIDNNPEATESQIIKKASIIMGISKGDA